MALRSVSITLRLVSIYSQPILHCDWSLLAHSQSCIVIGHYSSTANLALTVIDYSPATTSHTTWLIIFQPQQPILQFDWSLSTDNQSCSVTGYIPPTTSECSVTGYNQCVQCDWTHPPTTSVCRMTGYNQRVQCD